MNKFICIFLCMSSFCFGLSTSKSIDKNTKSLNKAQKQEEQIHKKLKLIAKSILYAQSSLKNSDKKIDSLSEQIKSLQADSKATHIKLRRLSEENKKLAKTKKELEEKIINIIAEKFSFYLFTDKEYQDSIDSIIADEVLVAMDTILKKDFQSLSSNYDKTNKDIQEHSEQISQIKSSLSSLYEKQNDLKKLKRKRKNEVKALERQKRLYRQKLEQIVAQREELKKTLEHLKIIKQEEETRKKHKKGTINSQMSVRQVGSSYQESKVKRYRGSKTIAPLKSFSIKQEFGNYIDPIYKIKIFNESVVLQSNIPNAKVRNVLSGKVIFAKDTAMLDKVVIVENKLGIHTIYAHLSQIAPTIKVGRWIKKAYIIGRVERDLNFEVTQKNYHINPLELIKY